VWHPGNGDPPFECKPKVREADAGVASSVAEFSNSLNPVEENIFRNFVTEYVSPRREKMAVSSRENTGCPELDARSSFIIAAIIRAADVTELEHTLAVLAMSAIQKSFQYAVEITPARADCLRNKEHSSDI
jgi:hypothetical protein